VNWNDKLCRHDKDCPETYLISASLVLHSSQCQVTRTGWRFLTATQSLW